MLAKKHKISNRKLIPKIINNGKSLNTSLFVIKYLYNQEEISHFGVVTSQKISKKAVERNKIRRRIFEAIRLYIKENPKHSKNINAVILTKKSTLNTDYKTMYDTISNSLSKIL